MKLPSYAFDPPFAAFVSLVEHWTRTGKSPRALAVLKSCGMNPALAFSVVEGLSEVKAPHGMTTRQARAIYLGQRLEGVEQTDWSKFLRDMPARPEARQ